MGVLSFSFTVGVIFGYKSCLIMYPTAMSVFYENIYFSCLLFIYGVCIGGCVRVRGEKNEVLVYRYVHINICEHELIYARANLAWSNKETWAKSCGVYISFFFL